MGKETGIQWTNHTWNPWQGCHKVSAGCKNCYMFRDKNRWGEDGNIVRSSSWATFNKPRTWKESAMVFTCSWSDWFIEEADAWRDDAWRIIKETPWLTYQILTKRPERIAEHLPKDWGDRGYPNVWLGVSVENQESAYLRIPFLIDIPAKVRFLSIEPILESIELNFYNAYDYHDEYGYEVVVRLRQLIHWVIVGGESGNNTGSYRARRSNTQWYERIIEQCKDNGVPVFVKQLGTDLAKQLSLKDNHGGDMSEWPENLRIREFPTMVNIN